MPAWAGVFDRRLPRLYETVITLRIVRGSESSVVCWDSDSSQNRGHHVLQVREQMRVRQVLVRCHKLVVDVDVEHPMSAWDQVELGDRVTVPAEGFSRHPGGTQRVASVLAVLQPYPETIVHHAPTSCDGITTWYVVRPCPVNGGYAHSFVHNSLTGLTGVKQVSSPWD